MTSAARLAWTHFRWVLVFAGARWVGGWLLALSPLSVVKASLISTLPGGDARLFEPGGLLLVEFLRLHGGQVLRALEGSVPLLALTLVLLLVPMARLLSALSEGGAEDHRRSLSPSTLWRLLGLMLASGVCVLLALAVVLIPTAVLLEAVEPHSRIARRASWAFGGIATLTVVGGVAILQDLTRVAIVRDGQNVLLAVRSGFSSLRQHFVPSFIGAASVACLSLSWIAVIAAVVGLVDVAQRDAWRIWAAFGLHLAAICGLTWLRAAWLARATALTLSDSRGVRTLQRAPDGTAEHNAAPVGPSQHPDASPDAPERPV